MKLSTKLLVLACAATVCSLAQAGQTLRFGLEAEYPPFESKTASGELQGFDIDLGNAVCAAAKLKCIWVENSFDGLIPALQAKKFDAINSAMNATDQRRKSIDFTDTIYRVPSMLIARKGSGLKSSGEGLAGKKVGVLQGSIQETYAKVHWEPKGVTVTSYQDQNQVYGDMAAGRLDATLVMAPAGLKGFLSKPEGQGFEFAGAVRDDRILGSGIAFGLRKGDAATRHVLDRAIAKVQASGFLKTLSKKYFGDNIDVSVK
jgi:lysine/arginine/ornithine transport system substrate-binding protein